MFQGIDSLFFMAVVLSVSFVYTTGNDLKDDRPAHGDRGGLWFGPRLGKRSAQLAEDSRDVYYRLIEAADTLKFYYDQLPSSYLDRRNEPDTRVTKKVIFTPKLGRSLGEESRQFDFTPRLGRRFTEDLAVTPTDQEIYRPDADRIGSRARYFSPRLGRTMNFSPRLGREIDYDNYTDNVRVARSVNDTKTSKR